MRIFLGLLVVLAVAGGFLAHRKGETPVTASAATAKASAAPREVSEHDWAKRSLDRAADVKMQVARERKENTTE